MQLPTLTFDPEPIAVPMPSYVALAIARARIEANLSEQITLAEVFQAERLISNGDDGERDQGLPTGVPVIQQSIRPWFEEQPHGWIVFVFMENVIPLETPQGFHVTVVSDLDEVSLHLEKCLEDIRSGRYDRQIINALYQPPR